jgi:diguanylate cyclase (GGDEF)-like protein
MDNNIVFLEIVIDSDTHKLISGDSKVRSMIKCDMFEAFEDNISAQYRQLFLENIEKADDSWFPTEVNSIDGKMFFYVRASKNQNGNMIKMTMVRINDLLDSHNSLMKVVNSYRAQLDLFEDLFFEYDPDSDTVDVFNAESAYFDAGRFTLDEFEGLICKNANEDQKSIVRKFINQMRAKTGRFAVRVSGNLLNDDEDIKATLFEGSFVFFGKESEGVVGHIHLDSRNGKPMSTAIKHDSLTGLVDKADIIRIAQERIDERRLQGTTLAILDVDFFKNVNDTYGHQFGDTVIKRVADIVSTEIGDHGVAGRFGGDEFLIVFYNIPDEESIRLHLRAIKNKVAATFPDKGADEKTPLSVSMGIAGFPKDADCYNDVFMVADYCLYIAKAKGRNRYVIYTPSKHGSLEDIRLKNMSDKKINERDITYGDVIVKMFDLTLHGSGSSPEQLMDEFADVFELQRVTLLVGEPFRMRYSAGSESIKGKQAPLPLLDMLNSPIKERYIADNTFMVVNMIDSLPAQAESFKEILRKQGILSYVIVRFFDKDKRECILMINSVGKQTQWNQTHYKYYRALGDVLSLYSLS